MIYIPYCPFKFITKSLCKYPIKSLPLVNFLTFGDFEMPSITEVAGHSTKKSCWVIISGTVYDVTGLIDHHPGGPDAILSLAGKDATEDFELFHSDGTLQSRPEQGKQPFRTSIDSTLTTAGSD